MIKNTLYATKNSTVPAVPPCVPYKNHTHGTVQTTVRACKDGIETALFQLFHTKRSIHTVKTFLTYKKFFTALICSLGWNNWNRREKRVYTPP